MRKLFRYLHNPILPHLPLETRQRSFLLLQNRCLGGVGNLDLQINIKVIKKFLQRRYPHQTHIAAPTEDQMQFSSFPSYKTSKTGEKGEDLFQFSGLTIIIIIIMAREDLMPSSKWSLSLVVQPTQPWAASFTTHCWEFTIWYVRGCSHIMSATFIGF